MMASILQNMAKGRGSLNKLAPLARWFEVLNHQDRQLSCTSEDQNFGNRDFLRSMFSLSGKVAFVTGCSGGIGMETCMALAKAGADVMITDYNAKSVSACKRLSDEIQALGHKAATSICDVRHQNSVADSVEECKEKLGLVDIMVANAGVLGEVQPPEDMDESEWRNVFATNTDGVFHCCRAAYPHFRKLNGGKVILMSSIASQLAAFSSSKGAIIPFAKSLAASWAKYNIQVNCILPGIVNTEFSEPLLEGELARYLENIPSGRLAEPADLIGAIIFFASSASNYCTGSQLVVDGGLSSNVLSN